MKHLTQLLYAVIQWHLKEVLILGLLLGGVITAIDPKHWWFIFPASLFASVIESMFTKHRRDKTLKK